jgi:CMP-N-acetylneuraminate monooxygenase
MHLRYLAHACVAVECGGFRLVIDPWLEGPCFLGGWWHAHPVPSDAREVLLGADAVFLSHNHPDHLHAPTLALLPRDTLILVPDFASGSVERAVRALGFTRIQALRQDDLFELGPALVLACIFAGDGRDDSGLYLASASGDVLLTVDANRLGNMALPSGVDVLLTSFASGASGFPVCFDTVSGPRCEAILARNRHAARSALEAYVRATRPQVWMPYAGFFTEADPRDASVHARNVKNTAEDVAEWLLARVEGLRAVLPLAHPRLLVHQHRVRADADIAVPHLSAHDPLSWRAARRARVGPLDEERLEAQLRGSGFQDDLILLLVPTDDSFAPIASAAWCVDFRAGPLVRRLPAAEALALLERAKQQGGDSPRHLLLRVREDSLAEAVALDRPWEDLTIGFQCRVDRHPDVYNSNFWHHFTNILPGRAHG